MKTLGNPAIKPTNFGTSSEASGPEGRRKFQINLLNQRIENLDATIQHFTDQRDDLIVERAALLMECETDFSDLLSAPNDSSFILPPLSLDEEDGFDRLLSDVAPLELNPRCGRCDADIDFMQMNVKRNGVYMCQSCVEDGGLDELAEREVGDRFDGLG